MSGGRRVRKVPTPRAQPGWSGYLVPNGTGTVHLLVLGESWFCFFRLGLSLSTGRFGAGCKLEVTFKRNAQRPPLYAATLEARSSFERFH